MAATFDHRATPELLAALKPGGFAHSLVRYTRFGRWPLDLQFRGYSAQGDHWVTLYMGLTKVLDMRHNSKGFWLTADKAWANKNNGWSETWRNRRSVDRLAADWLTSRATCTRSSLKLPADSSRRKAPYRPQSAAWRTAAS